MRSARSCALALALLAPASTASALSITLNPGAGSTSLISQGRDGSAATVSAVLSPTAVPYLNSHTADFGFGESTSSYDLSTTAFIINFDNLRAGSTNSFSRSRGDIFFSVDTAVNYLLSGSYTVVDSSGNVVVLEVLLSDITTTTLLARSYQESGSTPNESFVVGGSGGDVSNVSSGSLSGTLVAGNEYRLFYEAFVMNVSGFSESTAHGTGSATLEFVPEPSSALLLGAGLLVFASRRRRHPASHALGDWRFPRRAA